MTMKLPAMLAILAVASVPALAQSTAPAPGTPPTTPPAVTAPPTAPAPITNMPGTAAPLTDEQARAWVDKVVYSSDNTNLGEVAALQRDTSGKIVELHADIGGFLGLGESRVRLTPSQFRLVDDRVILNMTAEQAKSLPTIAKQ